MSDKYGVPPEMSSSDCLASEHVHRGRGRTFRRLVFVAVGVVAFLLTRAALAPDPALIEGPPSAIEGTWVTDDPRYADRAFVISGDEFHIQVAPGEVLINLLHEIRRTEYPEYDAYNIDYYTPEGPQTYEMRLYPDGVVRIKNPADVVWVRR